MARLQDFQSVTPTANDKFLIVQSQGQGLAPHTIKMDSANPTGTGALSLNRKASTTTGQYSVAIGRNGTASGDYSQATGRDTTASGSYAHAEGYQTTASKACSHAEGNATTASGDYSHAEGRNSTASGDYSHASGRETSASAPYAYTEGYQTTASGNSSHAEGWGTTANHRSQHVFGEYNVVDTSTASASSRGSFVEVVGNGDSTTRRNARTLDWNGNEVLAGDLTIKGNKSLDNAITPIAANLTYAQGVTYVSGGVYSVGKLVVINLRLSFDSAPSSGNDIVSGLPSALNLGTDLYTRFMTINGSYSVTTGGGLRAYNATSGVTIISGAYISV